MGNWIYRLKSGTALRRAIDNEDLAEVLDKIEVCYEEIHSKFPDKFDSEDLEEIKADIDNERDNLENYEDYDDFEYEDVEDNINYLLNNLYDFCDDFDIWIEM